MCVSPQIIPNPNFGRKDRFSFLKDCKSRYIKVPCGFCPECVHTKQLGIVQRCQSESLSGYPFFCTLTYNNDSLPFVGTSQGKSIKYADLTDVVNMIKRLRKSNAFGRRFRYFAVNELGSKNGRPHFHLLFFVEKYSYDSIFTPYTLERTLFKSVLAEWRRNIGSTRNPVYKPLCTYVRKFRSGRINTTFDLHFVEPSLNGSSDVSFYITKYMLKPSDKARRLQQALRLNLPPQEYDNIWSLVKPRWFSSLNFGFGIYDDYNARSCSYTDRLALLSKSRSFEYVRQCISRSRSSDYPAFYDVGNGKALPLSRYWKTFGNLFTADDALHFFYNAPHQFEDNVVLEDRSFDTPKKVFERYARQISLVDNHEFNFNSLF